MPPRNTDNRDTLPTRAAVPPEARLPAPPRLPTGLEPPAAKARPGPTSAPESAEAPRSSAALQIKVRDIKGWAALLVAVIGALFAGWAKLDTAPMPPKVEAVAANQWADRQQVDAVAETQADETRRLNATIRALQCRLDVLASAEKRQGYDPGFGDGVTWLSAYLPDRRVRATPAWVTPKTCPPIPKVPEE